MPQEKVLKTLIIGSGPAGLTAAIYSARAALKPVVLAGPTPGGLLTKTSEVENFPGFGKGIDGPKLMEEMIAQAQWCGAELLWEAATKLEVTPDGFTVTAGNGDRYKTPTLIYATGA